MSQCLLCHQDRGLCASHIVPDFLFQPIRNEKRQILGIDGLGNQGRKLTQKSPSEHLFCESCEQFLNDNFEKPFKRQWIDYCPLTNPWPVEDFQCVKVDYASFKLFHLSVLYRAAVSSLPMFAQIRLGPHEDCIRRMLLNCTPGKLSDYPIMGYAVIRATTREIAQFVGAATSYRQKGYGYCGLSYGGMQWWFCVSSHRNPDFERVAIQTDGNLVVIAKTMGEHPTFQLAGELLRSAPERHAVQVGRWKAASGQQFPA